MNDPKERAWVEVSLPKIGYNYRLLKEFGKTSGIIAVLKANAYGLDAEIVGKYLEKEGCDFFAAESIEEALKIRGKGIRGKILVLSPAPFERVTDAAENNIVLPAVSLEHAEKISSAAIKAGVVCKIHMAVDCGLSRFGMPLSGGAEKAAADTLKASKLPGIKISGVYTHFTEASVTDGDALNRDQMALFEKYFKAVKKELPDITVHGASSFMAMAYPEAHYDCMRVASFLWGIEPWPGRGPKSIQAVALRCRILQIKTVPDGTPIGYGPASYAKGETRLAIIPLGYADGLRRNMVGKIDLIVNGQRVPMVGKMFMDYTVLDVTNVRASEGDIVTVMGKDGEEEILCGQLAAVYPGTVGEVLAVLNPRLPRIYEE